MSRQRGLSLIELLVTLAIAAIVCNFALPSLVDFIKDARRTAVINELLGSLWYARNEAVTRNAQIVVCKSRDGRTCGGADVRWEAGWIVFHNRDADQPPVVDGEEPVLMVYGTLRQGARLHANRNYFTFQPLGTRSVNGTLVYCDDRGSHAARAVIVSVTGRPRVASRDAAGRPLSCA
ncbi:MAG TPA: GspH/FimT family pseudopilin [Gammaproteobacteria bacterium]|nr:GspH/FimT family pseudopilin [Gammaproteobacteria bacterium]